MNLWTKAGLAAGTARGGIIVGGFDSEVRSGELRGGLLGYG